MTPSADTNEQVLASLEAVHDDLAERKVLDAENAEKARKRQREIRHWLAPMCVGITLIVIGTVMVLFILLAVRGTQHQLRGNQDLILEGNHRVQAVTDCITNPVPTFRECVRLHVPDVPALPPTVGSPTLQGGVPLRDVLALAAGERPRSPRSAFSPAERSTRVVSATPLPVAFRTPATDAPVSSRTPARNRNTARMWVPIEPMRFDVT